MKRLVSMIAALAFCLTLLPVQSLAAERTDGAEQGLCPHHTEHTEDCGYLTDAECSFVCAICAVQRLIDGLPDAEEVTEETAEEIAAQIEEIEKAVEELSKQDAEQLEMEHYTEVSEALNVLEDSQVHTPLPQSDELVAKVTIDGTETEYSIGTGGYTDAAAAFQAAWAAAQGNTAVIDLVQDVTNSGTLEVNDASTEVTLNISDGVTLSIDRGGNNNCIKVQTGKFTLNGGVISTLSAGNNFSNVLYSSGGEVVLNGTAINSSYTGVVVAGGSVKIQNCEISVTSDLSSNYYRAYGVQITAGTGTIEGDTKIHVDTTNKTSVETCGVYLNGGTAVIESGTISVETGHLHSKGLNVSSGTAKVSGGTFFAKTTSTQVGAKASAVYWTNGKSPLLSAVDYAWYNEDKVQINIDMNKAVTEDTVKVAKKMVNITQQSTGGSVPLTYGYTQEDAPTFTIGAEAVNGGELTYQWYLNEKGTVEPVPGANTSSIRVPTGLNVISEQHKFYCIVSCNGYSLQSSNWLVYIQPREITAAVTLEDGPFEYKGLGIQVQPKVLSVRDENGNDIPESQYRITYTNGYNVGTGHSVTVSSKTGGNYSFITTVPFVITKAHRTLTITGAPETFTYGDAPFELGARLDGKTDTSIKWSVTNGSEVVSLEETADGAKITINGVGDVTIQAMKTGDSNYENSVAELTFTVQPKQLTVKSADAESRQYDGTSNVRITGVTLEGIIGQDEVSVDVSNLTGTVSDTKTGTYTAVNLPALSLIGADAEKYAVTQPEGEIGTQVEISKADQAAPDAPSAAEITDTSITLISAGDNAEYSKDGTNWQNSPEFTALTPNTEYTFHVRLKGDDNRNESPSSSAVIRTAKTELEGAEVTVNGSYTYTGAEIVPAAENVTVTLNGVTVDSSQYAISFTKNKNAGTAGVTVTAAENGNYSGSAETTFTIAQAVPQVAWSSTAQTLTYTGQPAAITAPAVTLVNSEEYSGEFQYSYAVDDSADYIPGLPMDAGTYTVRASIAEQDNYTAADSANALTLTIRKAEQDAPDAPSALDENITDTSIILISAGDNAEYSKDGTTWQDSPEFTGLSPNTEYTFYVRLKGDGNHNESPSSSAAIRTTKTGLDGAKVTVSGSYTYTGSAIVPAAKDVTVTLNGKTVDSSQYTIEVSDNIHAGTAAVTITATADGDFSGSVSGEYTIEKAALTIAANDQTLTYGESLAEGTDRVTLSGLCGGDTLKSVTFTASGTDVPGGEITLSAAQIENSDGTDRTEDYEIAYQAGALVIIKAQPAIAFASGYNPSKDYDGETVANPVAEQMEITGAGYDDVTFTWNAEPKDAGTYTLTADIAETGNREAASATLTVTIQKASPLAPKTGELSVADGRAQEYTYSLNALCPDVPDGMSLGTTEYTLESVSLGSYCTGGAKIEGKTLILPIQAVSSEVSGEIGTIAVTIHTGNFEDMAAMIRVRNISKIVTEGTPTLSAESILYGQTLQALTLTGSMRDMVNGKMVPGTFTWNSPNSRPDAQEKYAAEWTFTPDDTDTYANVSGTALIRVLPAPLTDAVIVLDPIAFRYDGAPHHPVISGVRLGETPLTADVDYTVSIPEGIEAGAYTVTLTGTGNYTGTAAAVFQINPVEQKPLDQTDDAGHELRLEVETGLSTVPEILKGDTRFDTVQKIADALRVKVSEILSDVKEQITVLDITLQCRDGSGEWRVVDPDHFPADGVTTILPYPAGTGAVGYIFTVQHLISSGEQAGMMETLSYTLTADGLQCRFSSLSPVAIGYQAEEQPTPPKPDGSGSGGGGSSRGPAYDITVAPAAHGEVRASRSRAESGTAVTLTVTPDEGYGLDRLTVTDSRGNEIRLTAKDGKFTFIMPAHAVTVEAGFVRARSGSEETESHPDCPSLAFSDLDTSDWYHEAVDFVLSHGMMSGTNHGFAPNASLSRAMLAQILWSHAGKPTAAAAANFPDVPADEWFSSAVDWAVSAGVVSGYSDGRFAPNDSVTREQFAVMLWRYAGSPAGEGTLDFSDTEQISSYAQEALRWAVGEGLISGKSGNRLDPQGTATRAEAAQMLFRFAKNL